MNRQDVFDKAVSGILKQGKPAISEISCVYLARDGSKCIVGQLLPDGHPGQEYAGSVEYLLNDYPDLLETLEINSNDDKNFLAALQGCHDAGGLSADASPTTWKNNFLTLVKDVAIRYSLDASILKKGFEQ